MLKFIGSLLLTPGVPILLSAAFPTFAKQYFNAIVVSQRRGNAGFIFIGDQDMAGEATAMVIVPPATATTVPFGQIEQMETKRSNPMMLTYVKVDGSAAETVQISGLIY